MYMMLLLLVDCHFATGKARRKDEMVRRKSQYSSLALGAATARAATAKPTGIQSQVINLEVCTGF